MSDFPWRGPHFSPQNPQQITHSTKRHTFVWYGVVVINKYDCKKKSSEKMKCVAQHVLFSYRKAQIRVWTVKVSFDPRQFAHTVTYMDIRTSSCSLQYQLLFNARMVSVG